MSKPSKQITPEGRCQNPKGSQQRLARRQLRMANPEIVPKQIAVCPECGGRLWWQVTSTDGLRDLNLDCENEPGIDDPGPWEKEHRNWQGEWQPVFDRVRRWVAGLSPSDVLCDNQKQ